MKRRTFLMTAGAAALAQPRRPNILILMTDQQSADAMSLRIGGRRLSTPHMDSLAGNGTLFSRAYCANPLCVPSRTSMFTGRYPAETRVQTNDTTAIDARRFPNMGTIFRQAGYDARFFGKWHLPYPAADSELHGFNVARRVNAKGDDGVAAQAAAFIRSGHQAPFLMVASFVNPHNICQWARGEALPDGAIGAPPPPERCPPRHPNHATPAGETDTMILMRRSYQNTPMFPVGGFDEGKWRQYLWAYYRMIEKVDGLIGQVLLSVRQAKIEEQTLIVFLADHGDCQGAHGWNQKTVFYDESSRVPLILSQKGVTRRGTSGRLAHTGVDLIPTLCGYAGIPVPDGLPGLSLMDTANGGSAKDPREYLVVSNKMVQGAPVDGRLPAPDGRMVRSRRFKYCVYSEGERRESLVDMEKDPGEMVNLAEDSRYRKVLDQHRQMLAAWRKTTGDTFEAVRS
jgi:arylsulfatase A-like enzyme